jgi:hypothetical protein
VGLILEVLNDDVSADFGFGAARCGFVFAVDGTDKDEYAAG